MDKKIRGRRKYNYWEPFYDPKLNKEFNDHDWAFEKDKGPNYYTFKASKINDTTKLVIEGVKFTNCDFSGYFTEYRLVFKKCEFVRCDFGLCTFRNAKFTDCKFSFSSFTQCAFHDSEFRGCVFKKIGLSGNSTDLAGTLITNPRAFVRAAYANSKDLKSFSEKLIQRLRLSETKATVARSILVNLSKKGSETNYYEGVKASTIQQCTWQFCNALLNIRGVYVDEDMYVALKLLWCFKFSLSLCGSILDYVILYLFGTINSWGASLARPLLIGCLILLYFGYQYSLELDATFGASIAKSAEIMFLFGYTSHVENGAFEPYAFANAILGVFWYIVTVPTVVNKLTRIRG